MCPSTIRPLIAALISLALAAPATAGTNTLVQFTNLSPYTATVTFPRGDSDCWHDEDSQDGRLQEYFDYYRRGAVSANGYRDFLDAFKTSYGITDFAALPIQSMEGTSAHLAPAVVGFKADTALFVGETSAAVFGGCKLATSRRGFTVTLTAADGTQLNRQRLVLADPPDDRWTLTRTAPGKPSTITLGAGGHGDPLEIALTAGATVLTLVSLGTATTEIIAARSALALAFEENAIHAAAHGLMPVSRWRVMLGYVITGGLRAPAGVVLPFIRNPYWGIRARTFYTLLADGVVSIIEFVRESEPFEWPHGATLDAEVAGTDFASPELVVNAALSDDRSICVYQTGTLGITECRLVGISLAIMPDGTLVFLPLPSVGRGD